MYLIVYTDGSIQIFAVPQKPEYHQRGAKIFEVQKSLTVDDISTIWANDGWNDKDIFSKFNITRLF